jgi:hypothetical protein
MKTFTTALVVALIATACSSTPTESDERNAAPASIALIEVPDVVGRTLDYAEGVVSNIDLVLVVESVENPDVEPGIVFEQLPVAGSQVTPATPFVARVSAEASATTTSTTVTSTSITPTTIEATTTTGDTGPETTAGMDSEIDEEIILKSIYAWGQSESARALQALLGLEEDGYYGNATRIAHIAELESRDLSITDVPPVPAVIVTTTRAATTTTTPTTTTSCTAQEPKEPRDLSATRTADGEVTFSWVPNLGGAAETYRVDYRIYGTSTWTRNTGLTPTSTSFVATGLTNDVQYEWSTQARNCAGYEWALAQRVTPLQYPYAGNLSDPPVAICWEGWDPENPTAGTWFYSVGLPAETGGTPILKYELRWQASGEWYNWEWSTVEPPPFSWQSSFADSGTSEFNQEMHLYIKVTNIEGYTGWGDAAVYDFTLRNALEDSADGSGCVYG